MTAVRLRYFGHSLGRNYLEVFAPWYEFTIQASGLDYEQSFFVPAVRGDYLEGNPVWAVFPHQ